MNDWLLFKYAPSAGGGYNPLRILSYGYDYFYVKTEERNLPGVTIIDMQGNLVDRRWKVPNGECHEKPVWSRTPLINAYTKQAGFYDG